LRLYQRLVEALAEEFDAEPAPETQRLYRAILDRRFPPVTQQAGARTSPPQPRPPPAPAPAPALGARPLGPFVDRERELALLVAGLGEALAGRGQALLLAGEPGIGKTRLIEELARIARERGAAVLWGRCYDGEGAPAYWPWMQIIRAYAATAPIDALRRELGSAAADIALVVPDLRERLPDVPLAATLDPEQTRFRLFDAVTAFLAAVAARTPLVLVLDDLHWADRSSLLLLEYLADALHGIPMLLVGSYRDVEVDRRHPVTRTLARFSREGTGARIQLTGFGPDDIARFSEVTTGQTSPAGLAEAIYAQTEGNPFFVREVVRLLVEEGRYAPIEQVGSWRISIPRGVREAIVLRLDRLSETTNRVLMVAAVIGREFHLAVLEQVSDLPPSEALAAVEDGLAAGALVESATSPGLFRFSHALIQQTLYEELSRARRVGLHRRIAEAIERVYAANLTPWLDTLAWHYYQAAPDGAPAKAIEYLTLAGTHAMDQVAWAEAAGHFARALELLDSLPAADERRRCELLLALGRVQQHAGDTALARATFLRAAAIARALDAPEQLARAALGAAATEEEVTPADVGSIELLEAAIAALGADDSALRATVLAQLSQALHYHDPSATARRRELSAEAVAIARRLGDEGTLATALLARLDAYWDPLHIDARLADTQEIIAIAERAGNARLALTGHAWRLVDLMELGDMAGVDTEIDAYGRLASDSRLPYSLWSHTNKRVMRTLVRGDFDEAERLAREAFALGARPAPGTADDIYLIHCFAIARERGGLEEIEARIRRLDLTGPVLSRIFPYLLALLYADLGRTVEARVEYERLVGQELERMPVDPHWLFAVALLADVCATLEDSATAGTLDQLLGPFAGRNVSIGSGIVCFGPVSTFLGRLAALLGRWDAAERHFGAAVAMARAMEAPPFVARGLLAWAEALRRRDAPGDQAAARGRLIEAREIATRHDMRLVGTRVAALLSRD
jgi:predicted ATPase